MNKYAKIIGGFLIGLGFAAVATVETATYISDLNATYPAAGDLKSEGDDHIRLLKSTIKATFANITGAVTATHTELNYVAGVTSAIQTQINAKAPAASPVLTGQTTNALGAVGAPSYSFTGDTNTGIYSPTADAVSVTAGGTEIARFDSVGINLKSGNIVGASTAAAYSIGTDPLLTNGGLIQFFGSAHASPNLIVGLTANTERWRTDASGRFLIGSPSSVAKFSVALGTGFTPGNAWDTKVATFGGGSTTGNFGIAYDDTNGAYLMAVSPGVGWKNLSVYGNDVIVNTNGATEALRVTSDGRLYGKALHNNAGAVTGTTNQYIASGTYTPTVTAVSNVAAVTASQGQWIRVGNVVTFSGVVNVDPTSASVSTIFDMSIPIASNFTAVGNAGGNASRRNDSAIQVNWSIEANATDDRLTFRTQMDTLTSAQDYTFSVTYLIQ